MLSMMLFRLICNRRIKDKESKNMQKLIVGQQEYAVNRYGLDIVKISLSGPQSQVEAYFQSYKEDYATEAYFTKLHVLSEEDGLVKANITRYKSAD